MTWTIDGTINCRRKDAHWVTSCLTLNTDDVVQSTNTSNYYLP